MFPKPCHVLIDKEVVKGRSGHLEYEYDNKIWLASYRPINSTGWGIVVQQPVADIYGPINRNMTLITRFFIASFVLCIAIILLSIRYTLTPLTGLARSIARGDLLQSDQKYAKDEVGQLATMFRDLFNKNLGRSQQDPGSMEGGTGDLPVMDSEGTAGEVDPGSP